MLRVLGTTLAQRSRVQTAVALTNAGCSVKQWIAWKLLQFEYRGSPNVLLLWLIRSKLSRKLSISGNTSCLSCGVSQLAAKWIHFAVQCSVVIWRQQHLHNVFVHRSASTTSHVWCCELECAALRFVHTFLGLWLAVIETQVVECLNTLGISLIWSSVVMFSRRQCCSVLSQRSRCRDLTVLFNVSYNAPTCSAWRLDYAGSFFPLKSMFYRSVCAHNTYQSMRLTRRGGAWLRPQPAPQQPLDVAHVVLELCCRPFWQTCTYLCSLIRHCTLKVVWFVSLVLVGRPRWLIM